MKGQVLIMVVGLTEFPSADALESLQIAITDAGYQGVIKAGKALGSPVIEIILEDVEGDDPISVEMAVRETILAGLEASKIKGHVISEVWGKSNAQRLREAFESA